MKGKRKIRKDLYERNVSELRKLHEVYGLEVYEHSRLHLRIVGKLVIDFWPSTGRAWEVGSATRSRIMTVDAVCEWAAGGMCIEILPEGAQMHLDSMVVH